ncbi:MAG: SulP family inorganic anion transporter [Thermoleophilia bacterium]
MPGPPPGIAVARSYRASWLRADLTAGLVLTALLVPQGVAYAELAGLPPVAGLYATMVPLLVYAVFGPSRILVMAPDSAIAPMVAATVIPLAGADPDARLATAGTLAVLVGALCIAGGLARFGFLTQLLSLPVRVGYLAGIAVTVLAAQVPKLMGIDADGELAGPLVADAAGKLGDVDGTEVLIGLACLAVILGCRRFAPRVPGVFLAVAGSTLAVWALDLDVATMGALPGGLPVPGLEVPAAGDLAPLLLGAIGIAFVAFADTSVLSRSYATRLREHVDQDRELMALGTVNLASGLFQGFPLSSSSSRTPVAEAAGARTQLTGVVGAVGIAVLLVAAPGVLRDLPQTALAAIVIAAVIGLVDAGWLRRTYRVRRSEFVLAAASLLGVVVLGVLYGVAVAVGLSLLNFVRRAWRPNDAVLGRVDGLKGYHDVSRHPSARQVPGLLVFRFDSPLFFANAEWFRDRVLALVDGAERPVRRVVIAAEPMTDVDLTAAEVLRELHGELRDRGVELAFAEMKDPVRERLERYGLMDLLDRARFHPTVGTAVRDHVGTHGVAWTDWEDGGD